MIMLIAAGHAHAQSPESQDSPQARASADSTRETAAPEPQPVAIDQLTLDDDLIAAVGLRPIAKRRVEALVSTGTDSTHDAALRATDTVGGFGLELTGTALRSDALADRTAAGARIEHASERNALRANASYGAEHLGLLQQSFATDSRVIGYDAAWTGWRSAGRFELQAYGEQAQLRDVRSASTLDVGGNLYGAHAGFASRRVQAFGFDHEFGGDIDVTQAAGMAAESDSNPEMPMKTLPRTKHARKRFLSAYIHDTIRVIESLDVHGGFVFEHWAWLTNLSSIYGPDPSENMDPDGPDTIGELVLGPRLGAVYRASPELALEAQAYRQLRTPTWQQLMRPVQNGNILTVADDRLHAASVTGAEVGPALTAGAIEARAVVYWHEVASPIATVSATEPTLGVVDPMRAITNLDHARETGVEAAATWRVATPVLAGVAYTFTNARITDADAYPQLVGKQMVQTPRHRATAMLAYDAPKLATVTTAVRYVDRRFEDDRNTMVAKPFAVVDAMAARNLTHALAGFVGVENLFGRRYVANQAGVDTIGAPRLVSVGLRLDH